MSSTPTTPEKSTAGNGTSPKRREVMIGLAIDLIARGGLTALTYRSLATAAEVSVGTVQQEFPTRINMLEAIFERNWKNAGMRPEEAEADEPLAKLFEVCSRAAPISDPPDPDLRAYFELLTEMTRDPELKRSLSRVEEGEYPLYIRLIERAQQAREIDPGLSPDLLLSQIWALSDGFCLAAYLDPETSTPQSVREAWTKAFDSLVAQKG
jgi:AcrR family transcriptional regulator